MTSVWIFNAHINASLDEVKKIFLDVRDGEFSELTAPLLVTGKGPVKITLDKVIYTITFSDDHLEYISIAPQENKIAVQGEWWYRGEYTLTTSDGATNVQLEVFNLADQEWMVSLMNIGAKRKHEIAFLNLCNMVERRIS